MSASAEVTQFIRSLEANRQRMISAALNAVDRFGRHVLGDAQEICPVDTSALQNSATEQPAVINGDMITKTIGFNTSYAAIVHEMPNERISTEKNPLAQSKFLETALRKNLPKLPGFVKQAMDGAR